MMEIVLVILVTVVTPVVVFSMAHWTSLGRERFEREVEDEWKEIIRRKKANGTLRPRSKTDDCS